MRAGRIPVDGNVNGFRGATLLYYPFMRRAVYEAQVAQPAGNQPLRVPYRNRLAQVQARDAPEGQILNLQWQRKRRCHRAKPLIGKFKRWTAWELSEAKGLPQPTQHAHKAARPEDRAA